MRLDGVAAVVSGGSSGLGRATARALLEGGAAGVVAMDLKEPADPQAGLHFVETDVTSEDSVRAALAVAGEIAPLRVAVSCAGVGWAQRTVSKQGPHPLDVFATVVRVNLIGTFNVIRLAAEAMSALEPVEEERGVIVNTASVAAFDGQIGQAAYSASKGGVVGLTLPVARDLAGLKIRVVTIAPGLFDTPMLAALPEEARASLGAQVPHPSRLGEPREYGALARHIVETPCSTARSSASTARSAWRRSRAQA